MRGLVIAAIAGLLAAPANARQADDGWDLIVDESQNMMLAVSAWSSGQTLAVRCRDGDLELLLSGLPPLETPSRYVEAAYADGRVEAGFWFNSGGGAMAFSPAPGLDARRLRQGGPLQLSVAVSSDNEAPLRRYALDLPSNASNLDQVLADCGADRPDPREQLVRWNIPRQATGSVWAHQPAPHYPPSATSVRSGVVVLSCIADGEGRLADCRIERESQPRRLGFGESALRSLRDARTIPAAEGGPAAGRLLVLTIRFQIA